MMLFGGGAAEVRSGFFAWYQNPGASGASGLSRARQLGVDTSGFIYYGAYIWNSSSGIVTLLMKVNGATGVVQWARQLSGPVATGYNYCRDIAVDSSGNCYVVSAYNNASVAREPAYVAKYNSSGVIQWQRQIADTGAASTALGNYAVGLDSAYSNIVTFGPSTSSPSGTNFFLTSRATSTGAVSWQRTLGTKTSSGANIDQYYGALYDSSGNIYVVGSSSEMTGTQQTVVAKYTSAGTLSAQIRINGTLAPGQTSPQSNPAIDASGNLYMCIYDVGRGQMNVVKLSSSLTITWQFFNSGNPVDFRACCVDSLGNVYTCGYGGSTGTVNVTKFNSSGTPQWTNQISFTGVPSTNDYCINVQPVGTEKDFYVYPTFSVTTNTPNYYIFGSRVPTSGTKNTFSGSFGAYSVQYLATTLITASSGSLAANTTTLAGATPTFTDSAGAAVDVAVSPATISQIQTYS
jgi:hypothetical protein